MEWLKATDNKGQRSCFGVFAIPTTVAIRDFLDIPDSFRFVMGQGRIMICN
jgi:hypothetical protein